ncbi:MAG: hypothetical protein P4L54_04865 [Acidocella sp.]|nr:hypothetical protein [Acidocella sp.]
MKHTPSTLNRNARRATGVSLIALTAMLGAAPAMAAVINPAVPSVTGFDALGSDQTNSAQVTSSITGTQFINGVVATVGATTNPSTLTVDANTLSSLAQGNMVNNSVTPTVTGNVQGNAAAAGTGIGVLSAQTNTNPNALVNSTVSGTLLEDLLTNAVSRTSVDNSSNSITSEVQGNLAQSAVSGVLPTTYGTPVAGISNSASTDSANIIVGTNQTNTDLGVGVGSLAVSSGNTIETLVNSSAAGATQLLGLASTQNNNTESATFQGNQASNDINIALTSGANTGEPTLNGSLGVVNQQANTGIAGGGGTGAEANSSSISTIFNGGAGLAQTELTGSTTQNGNSISAAAAGNAANAAFTGGTGNLISLGINLTGATGAAAQLNSVTTASTVAGSSLSAEADLLLTNFQGNTTAPVFSSATGNSVFAQIEGASGASIALGNNSITSSTDGNTATNAIDTTAGATINSISGLAALASLQTAGGTSGTTALTSGNSISATVGDLQVGNPLGVTGSTISLTGNSIGASDANNNVSNGIGLTASNISTGATTDATLTSVTAGTSTAAGGITINNQQYSAQSSSATTSGNTVEVTAAGSATAPNLGVSNNTLTVGSTSITATDNNNNASNGLTLDGTTGVTGSAGLLNDQASLAGASATVSRNTAEAAVNGTDAATSILGDAVLVSGTFSAAQATDNNASNALSVSGDTVSNVTGQPVGLTSSLTAYTATGQADLVLSNLQTDNSGTATTATNTGTTVEVVGNSDTAGNTTNAPAVGGGSSFTVSGLATPSIEALGFGNSASNSVTVNANTLSDAAGLLSAQSNLVGTSAGVTGATVEALINTTANTGAIGGVGSPLSVTVGTGAVGGSDGNTIRAITSNNDVSNSLSVAATGATLHDTTTAAIINTNSADVQVAGTTGVGSDYSLLNNQLSSGPSSATVNSSTVQALIGNTSNPAVTDLQANVDGNSQVAAAYGNQASNAGSVSATNLVTSGTYKNAADVTNVQTTSGDGTISASVDQSSATQPSFTTQVDGTGTVTGSQLATSANSVVTLAEGNQATATGGNTLNVGGGSITDVSAASLGGLTVNATSGLATAPLAFDVQNVQIGGAIVNASQGTSATTPVGALTSVGGNVVGTNLSTNGNLFSATGYNNNAASALTFGGATPPTSLDTSGGTQNFQSATAAVGTTLGAPGSTAGTTTTTVNFIGTVAYVAGGNEVELNSNAAIYSNTPGDIYVQGPVTFTLPAFTPLVDATAYAALFGTAPTTIGGTLAGGYTVTITAGGVYTSSSANIAALNAAIGNTNTLISSGAGTGNITGTFSFPVTTTTSAAAASPYAIDNVGGSITNSQLNVNANMFKAASTANAATTTTTVNANTVVGGADVPAGTAAASVSATVTSALADYATSNNQSFTAPVTAQSYSEAAINPLLADVAISGSALSVNGNQETTAATGNNGNSSLTIAANSTTATGAVVSNQSGNSNVEANSGTAFNGNAVAPLPTIGQIVTSQGAMTGSTLSMSSNTNESTATVNTATNALNVTSTTLATSEGAPANAVANNTGGDPSYPTATADFSLANAQTATGGVAQAGAVSQVQNTDTTAATTTGLQSSTATLDGNITSASANGNVATDTLALAGTNVAATSALTSSQSNFDTVETAANSTVQFSLNGNTVGPVAAINTSTVNVSGNAVDASSYGNSASNSSSVTATDVTDGTGATAPVTAANGIVSATATATATYALSNVQQDAGNSTASTVGLFGVNLTPNDSGIINSTLNVTGNSEQALALGNGGGNSLSLDVTNAGGTGTVAPTGALVSEQALFANVSATSTETAATQGAVSGSTLNLSGNTNTAVALGNDVANTLSVVATNLLTQNTAAANGVATVATTGGPAAAAANYSLTNAQQSSGDGTQISAVATTTIHNSDSAALTTTGLLNSTATLTGNTTTAQGFGNYATNALDLTATNNTATAALTNSQSNADPVSASGVSNITYSLNGGVANAGAAQNATISVGGNAMNVLAEGNNATNALNATTAANYGAQTLDATTTPTAAGATFAVLNSQNNTAAVSALASGSSNAVALNGGGGTGLVSNTTVSVSYNTVNVAAYGNIANNTVTVTALNSGNPTVALQNTQNNAASVTASSTGMAFSSQVGIPGASASTFNVNGNGVSVSAVGNSAVNVIK